MPKGNCSEEPEAAEVFLKMNTTQQYPTLLVEDHQLMRETLSNFLADVPEVDLIAAVGTGEEALRMCEQAKPKLALIDVSLPEMSGIELVREIRQRCPETVCLMLSGHQEVTYIRRAMENGARGYILKGDPIELIQAIEHGIRGEIYLSEAVRDKLEAAEASGE